MAQNCVKLVALRAGISRCIVLATAVSVELDLRPVRNRNAQAVGVIVSVVSHAVEDACFLQRSLCAFRVHGLPMASERRS